MSNDKELLSAIKWASKNHVKKAGKYYTKDYSIIAYTPERLVEEYKKSLTVRQGIR